MGGEGSGRPPNVETLIKRQTPNIADAGEELILPNYSGLQKVKKTDPIIADTELSGSFYVHLADSSDPHGTILTQTNINSSGTMSGSTILVTSDKTLSGSAYVPNIVFGTVSGSHTASNYTQGSLLVIYTP